MNQNFDRPKEFDPYHLWLGIPPEQQPPNHYRLLGLPEFTSDEAVIEGAADRQMTHVHTFQVGEHTGVCQRILRELSEARICLLDVRAREAYDGTLRLNSPHGSTPSASPAEARRPHANSASPPANPAISIDTHEHTPSAHSTSGIHSTPASPSQHRRQKNLDWKWYAAGIAVVALLLIAGAVVLSGSGDSDVAKSRKDHTSKKSAKKKKGGKAVQGKTKPLPGLPTGKKVPGETTKGPINPVVPPIVVDPKDHLAAKKLWEKGQELLERGDLPDAIDTLEKYILHEASEEHRDETEQLLKEARNAKPDDEKVAEILKQLSDEQFELLQSDPLAADIGFKFSHPALKKMFYQSLRDNIPNEKRRRTKQPPPPPTDTLTTKLESLVADIATIKGTAAERRHIDEFLSLADKAVEADRCDVAFLATKSAYQLAQSRTDEPLKKGILARGHKMKALFLEWQKFRAAEKELMTDPNNPSANAIVGRRYCFFQGRWEEGLPLLAASNDTHLRVLATADIRAVSTAQDQLLVADRWWDAAAKQPISERGRIRERAGVLYRKAEMSVAKFQDAMRVAERLAELEGTKVARFKPGLMAARLHPVARSVMLRLYGGDEKTEEAVNRALRWISRHQFADGGWSFDHASSPASDGRGLNGGRMTEARNAATSLALLALLGAGQTPTHGKYKKTVDAGLRYLVTKIKVDKNGGSFHESGGRMYSHALATMALCEAYGMTRNRGLRTPTLLAVDFINKAQDPLKGGWMYERRDGSDTSVTAWQLTALKTAEGAGISNGRDVAAKASSFLDRVQFDGGTRYGYTSAKSGSNAMTAAALTCRRYMGWGSDKGAMKRGTEYIASQGFRTSNMYFSYYGTQLLRHQGGEQWELWNASMRKQLLPSQVADGQEAGSWYFASKYAKHGGRLFTTVLATLMLESYYRHTLEQ